MSVICTVGVNNC